MHIAARKGLTNYVRYLHKKCRVEADIKDVDGITPAIHALYLDDDEKVKEIISTLLDFDKKALDIKPIWINDWTCADLARAMGKSKALVDWLATIAWPEEEEMSKMTMI
ncbi:hypothetical protein BFJ69_g16748 [Fusarium oxysporum]|uniref:Ankyrin repeat protein n=1 Tax=Fusarium oxysporum TaxID=5507 RepID=A0A420MA83_FUSOX|nr:hypothetical protein BFJ69_g16748 [Fusarium oxysporum]